MIVLTILAVVFLVALAFGLVVSDGIKGFAMVLGLGAGLYLAAVVIDALVDQEASCRECEVELSGQTVSLSTLFATVALAAWVLGSFSAFLLRAVGGLLVGRGRFFGER